MINNFSEYSKADLLDLRKKIDEALQNLEVRRLQEATAAVEAVVAEFGFTLSQVTGGKNVKGEKAPIPPKYRNPETSATWSGRGRMPRWITDHIDFGGTREDFLISSK